MTTETVDPAKKWWPPNGYLAQWILDQFEPGYRGYAIDVGASDGLSVNTTWALEKHHFWTVVSVEPNPVFHPYLLKERAMVEKCALASEPKAEAVFYVHIGNPESFSSLNPTLRREKYATEGVQWKRINVEVKTLDQVLERWQFPRLDALCLDTEGTELDILAGCDLARWLPRVIIAECWDEPIAIQKLLEPYGYKRVAKSVDNHIWRREDK